LEDSLVKVFLERVFILSMNDDSVLRLTNFLAANKGATSTLPKVLRVSRYNVFRIDGLIRIAIVNRCSDIYKNQINKKLLERLLGSYFYLPWPPAKSIYKLKTTNYLLA
jgi:hypothetical protein